jgi:PAS domain S-box-containing protein
VFTKLKTWASYVSSTDPDEVRRQKLLNILLMGLGMVALVNLLIGIIFQRLGHPDMLTLVHGTAAALMGSIIAYFLNRYVSGVLASSLFLLVLILAVALGDTPRQVVEGRSLFNFTIPILLASAVLRPWASFLAAGVSSAAVSVITCAFLENYVPPIPSLVSLFAVAFISWLSARSLERALDHVREINDAAQREIAERKRAEAALKESEARYRVLIDMCPDSFVLTDLEGTYVMCNQQTVQQMEAGAVGDLLGTNVLDRIAEPDREEAKKYIQETIERGITRNKEYRVQTVKGTRFPAEINAALLRDADGNPTGFIGLTRDLTERKAAEAALRRSNAELRAINAVNVALNTHADLSEGLDKVIDEVLKLLPGINIWFYIPSSGDASFHDIEVQRGVRALHFNKKLRTTIDDFVRERKMGVVVTHPDAPPTILRCDALSSSYRAVAIPLQAKRDVIGVLGIVIAEERVEQAVGHNGALRAVDLRFLRAVSGQVALAVENIRLTREAAEAQALRELDRMRSELIANFTHDLKSPLGLIKISCTTLMREDIDFEKRLQLEMLEDISAQTDRLTSIVDRVLELGQMESGNFRFHRQSADLGDLIQSTVASMRNSLNDRHFRCSLSDTSMPVRVDAKRVEEVLRNLLSNAVKYSPEKTEILVRGECKDEHVLVSVRDQGIGVPEKDLSRVFERFYRADNALTQQVDGSGLGLAVSRSIIQAHGGRIWAENNPDRGLTVRFTLPLHREE